MNDLLQRMRARGERVESNGTSGALDVLAMLSGQSAGQVRAHIAQGGELRIGGFRLTKKGLQVEAATVDDWQVVGQVLGAMTRSMAWLWGDWAALGFEYDRSYPALAAISGLQESTLYNYASIAQAFDFSRRREKLTFKHHAVVAALEPDLADMWLAMADQMGWTVEQLREEIRQAAGAKQVAADERAVALRDLLSGSARAIKRAQFDARGVVADDASRAVLWKLHYEILDLLGEDTK